jgi:hypothetical protein
MAKIQFCWLRKWWLKQEIARDTGS